MTGHFLNQTTINMIVNQRKDKDKLNNEEEMQNFRMHQNYRNSSYKQANLLREKKILQSSGFIVFKHKNQPCLRQNPTDSSDKKTIENSKPVSFQKFKHGKVQACQTPNLQSSHDLLPNQRLSNTQAWHY